MTETMTATAPPAPEPAAHRAAKDREWTGSGLTDAYGRLLDRYYAAQRRVAVLTNELEEAKAREERAKAQPEETAA